MHTSNTFSKIAIGLALLILAAPSYAKDTLVIGKVSINPKKHFHTLQPIAQYVANQMQDLGITQSKVVLARNNDHMVRLLKSGQVDWVTETPFPAIEFEERAGAEMLLRKWKKGVPEYHTVFFTRKDSGIDSLAQLPGKTIAFEDEGSSSAYFIPAATLIQQQLPLFYIDRPRQKPPTGKVGYLFSGAEINTSTWVHKGITDVGALSNLDWNRDDHVPLKFKTDFKVIHRTPPFPRAIELVNSKLSPAIKERLKEILLNIHQDEQATEVLKAYQKTTRFDAVDAKLEASIEQARVIHDLVNEHLN